ncbi:Mur ligase domain-containing protein, partial [Erysipelothrix rhusiopathiae]|nr:Mur ligase domain-containing protein [Erysipelothrix rhusiopathiae]
MFFCLKGLTVDGHQFAKQAVENGAVAVVHSDDIDEIEGIVYICVDDVMTELHRVTDIFYNSPSKNMYVYGITGTNGKSTTMLTV